MREINITHLYPELLNLHGDKGNISALFMRCKWRNIEAKVVEVNEGDVLNLENTDILFIGGGGDKEQKLVCNFLMPYKDKLIEFAENGGVILATCGGYPMLGKFFETETERNDGLSILDIESTYKKEKIIGNAISECEIDGESFKILGFENHSTETKTGNLLALAKVIKGGGNDGISGFEGVLYKNVFATYLTGPLLPKNPKLTDAILKRALIKKYGNADDFIALDDKIENETNTFLINR